MISAIASIAVLLVAMVESAASQPAYEVRSSGPGAHESLLAADWSAWQGAQSIMWGPREYATVFRALWSEAGLFVRFDATDPHPWFTKQQHDGDLWREEVVEIFLDADSSGADYIEIDFNPGNFVCDVHVDAQAWRFDTEWNLHGLKSRVQQRRDTAGRIIGWTVTAFLPWTGMSAARATPGEVIARRGDRWRFNVFRIERPYGAADPQRDALFLAWSATDKPSFHAPEAFRAWVLR